MAETLADLLREVGIDYRSAAVRGAEQAPGPAPLAARDRWMDVQVRPTPRVRQGDYARERQYRVEGARDQFMHGRTLGDRVGAAGTLAANALPVVSAFPMARNAFRAGQAGDYVSAGFEGGQAALEVALAGLPRRGAPLFGAMSQAPARFRAGPSLADMVDGHTMPGSGNLIVGALRRQRAPMDNEAWFERPMPVRSLEPNRVRPTDGVPPDDFHVQHYMNNPDHNPIVVQRPRGLRGMFRRRGDFDVIDGHHRLEAARRRGVPVEALDASEYFGRRQLFEPSPAAPAARAGEAAVEAPRPIPLAIRPQTRASDGSILPRAEPRPFSSTAGTSADLREAAGLPSLTRPTQREEWATSGVRNNRGYEFRGPKDTRYGLTIENTPEGAQVALETRMGDDVSQYGRQGIFNAGEARSVFRRAMAALERDMAERQRPEYILAIPKGLRPQHRRIFEGMAEQQARANGWPGYALERRADGEMVLRRDGASPSRPQHDPMQGGTPEARERLRAQGFDVDTPLYHGTAGEWSGSDFRGPTYLSPRAEAASIYAGGVREGGRVLPTFTRGKFKPVSYDEIQTAGRDQAAVERYRREGYDGLIENDGDPRAPERLVFDPRNIRSRFARGLDSDSSDLLASVGAPLAGAALLNRKRRK